MTSDNPTSLPTQGETDGHILVVDDDGQIRHLVAKFLRENGHRVTVARDGREMKQILADAAIDLIVLDIMMPGENGLALIESLRQGADSIPVLMLSALADPSDRIAGLTAGSDDYLSKPFEPRELLLRIGNLLKRSATAAGSGEVRFGPFTFNVQRGELRKDGEPLRLTGREKDFLRALAANPGLPVARADLAQPGSEESAKIGRAHV